MTPQALLDAVLKRFSVMYLSEEVQVSLLDEALETYQRLVSPFKDITTAGTATEIATPGDFLSVVVCSDTNGRWHKCNVSGSSLQVVTTPKSEAPYTIHYFVNLTGIDIEEGEIPADCVPLLRRYLRILINIENTKRHRDVIAATGIQVDLPSSDELENSKAVCEEEMVDAQAIIPMATVC